MTSHLEMRKQLQIIQTLQAEKAAMESELLNVGKRSIDPELELHQDLISLKEENQRLVTTIDKAKAGVRAHEKCQKIDNIENTKKLFSQEVSYFSSNSKKGFTAFQTKLKSDLDCFTKIDNLNIALSVHKDL